MSDGLVGISEDHFGLEIFSLRELLVATDNFSNKNILGRGGYGTVYKGRLADGSLVAVTRFTEQRDQAMIEKELEISSLVAHRNVNHLRGFCFMRTERLIVCPYMANGSVASCLRGRADSEPLLDWAIRQGVALGVAKGLAYLHHECVRGIIHRDIKAANILLDEDFEAVVADFSLATFVDCNDDDGWLKETIGYIAPEYLITKKCSVKSDVYGYGIFVLELITARRPFDLTRLANDEDMMLLDWVRQYCEEKNFEAMVNPDLGGNYVDEEVEKLLQITLICTESDPDRRPTMSEVVRMLEDGDGLAERWYMKTFKDENLGHVREFTLQELEIATENFSNKIISTDGFNMVYKGWLADGSPVVVKRFNSQSLEYYFQTELDIGRIPWHPNLLEVIGFCSATDERMLVFPLMANGSVASWLRGGDKSRPPLTWQKRKEIALGAAKGLAYLHNGCGKKIIHRDINSANILLDEEFHALVSDFELAKFMDSNVTHATTVVRGTIGHIAPEYLATGKCSDKTDVYGYGAFLLELITGKTTADLLRLANDEGMMFVDWVKRYYKERKWGVMEAVVEQLVQISLLCRQCTPGERPRMSEVVRMLEVGLG